MSSGTYWVTFHIKDQKTPKGTYGERYSALIDTLQKINDGWWARPTSFILFGSSQPRSEIVKRIKQALDVSVDVAVVGASDYKVFELIGGTADDLEVVQSMVSFAKKV